MLGRTQPAAFRRIVIRHGLQPPLSHPNQRRHRAEGKPKAHSQSRERVEQQHRGQSLPPSPPRRRAAAPIPLPGKHRQHQQTALNRHAETGQGRIKQSRCQARCQIPASRLGQRQAQQQKPRQIRCRQRHHTDVQPRHANQMIDAQHAKRLPMLIRQPAVSAAAQSLHQRRPVRVAFRRLLPGLLPLVAPVLPTRLPARVRRQFHPLAGSRSHAVDMLAQRPSLAVEAVFIALAHRRPHPHRHPPAAARPPFAQIPVGHQQPKPLPRLRLCPSLKPHRLRRCLRHRGYLKIQPHPLKLRLRRPLLRQRQLHPPHAVKQPAQQPPRPTGTPKVADHSKQQRQGRGNGNKMCCRQQKSQ